MNESNSIETLTYTHSNLNLVPLSYQTTLRLAEINKRKDGFNSEIQERRARNTLLLLIILTRLSLFYLQQVEEQVLFLLQVLLEFLQE